jgi:hypothetical protein
MFEQLVEDSEDLDSAVEEEGALDRSERFRKGGDGGENGEIVG